MKYTYIIRLLIFLQLISAQSKVGTSAAPFLGINVGASSVGLSGAITSHAFDASVLYINPGAIAQLDNSQILLSKTNWIVDTHINFISSVFILNSQSAMGFFINHLDYGSEEITDLNNQDGTGLYWSASDIVTGIAYAQNLTDRFSLGGTLKYIYQRIHNERASALATDVGLLYRTTNEKFKIGMSVSNWGSDMAMDGKDLYKKIDLDPNHEGHNETLVAKMKTDNWPLPLFFRVGLSSDIISNPTYKMTLLTDAFIPSDDVETIHLGLQSSFSERVFLRCGYRNLGNPDSMEGFTLGVGTKLFTAGMAIGINYSIQEFGYFGLISQIDISIDF
ncbi:MAG: PorV/PorQ family protein [Candidatus Marinimicrobia bacterium]|jgi:hypothetical protein|nr:PorV/PorQ family protein [Candidatus Neomarinimicrobiota bacterium]MBT4283227.1 PorV/PorQ family protein [Candidatus Neomarinimicrobiota bacterium]MBT4636821.1 PorV/PorQ family protein [Candidatus Neomarinimicrobiota bacterium]MBT5069620.1 PorV/PorQ family protein [Candidatus Neomarinimicrobiota bacterium]MBT5760766.1 PorV/PorQ family protein [Candidatus Neomarinimicrobiota bacterium]